MNTEYRYLLEKGSKKHFCPECKKKTFVYYVDTKTGEHLPEQYGRCDRESKCTYHLNPYKNGYAKMIWEKEQKVSGVTLPKQKYIRNESKPKPVFFDFETFKQTLETDRYEKNNFLQNLLNYVQFPFNADDIGKVVALYRLGTIAKGYRKGALTIPFIDINGNIRAIQVKQFDKNNHTTGTDFLHSIIEKHHTQNNDPLPKWLKEYINQDKRISCLFGEHLLNKYPNNPIALVEAPKTAVYGSLYFGFPDNPKNFIWIAVYNKSSFSFDKMRALQGRFVYVFPDLSKDGSTFKEWEAKAKEYESRMQRTKFIFSELLEKLATPEQREKGADIADILILQDWRAFRQKEAIEPPTANHEKKNIVFNRKPYKPEIFDTEPKLNEPTDNWSQQITELDNYFNKIEFSKQPIKLNSYSTILDCSLFFDAHISIVKANNGNKTFLPYLNRLNELKTYFENNNSKNLDT